MLEQAQTDPIQYVSGHLEVGAAGGQVVIYIPALDRHVAFSPDEALRFSTLVLAKAKDATLQRRAIA